jgi:hypothetical protein
VTLTLPQSIATSSSPQFTAVKTGSILDSNSNTILQFTTTASAVNYINIVNDVTGGAPNIAAKGSDTDVALTLSAQGADPVNLVTQGSILGWYSGTSSQHLTRHNLPTTAGAKDITWPDASGTVLLSGQAINTVPSITFSSTTGIVGTTTNNNAAAGSVGEVISSVVASTTVTLTTNTAANVTSISLTAGDWNVWGNVVFDGNSATTVVYHAGWISTTSATLPANNIYASKPYSGAGTAIYSALVDSFVVPLQRISIAGTTTVYLSVQSGFGVNADKAGGAIYARRVR